MMIPQWLFYIEQRNWSARANNISCAGVHIIILIAFVVAAPHIIDAAQQFLEEHAPERFRRLNVKGENCP